MVPTLRIGYLSWHRIVRHGRVKRLKCLLVAGCMAMLTGCEGEGRGFRLPEGDVDAGRATFVSLGCNDCHHIASIDRAADSNTNLTLRLGGIVTKVKTYGELVTSIINPSHKIARPYPPQPVEVDGNSAMRAYNDIMTVQQLVDLVTFLESEYELLPPEPYL